jgi:hypothetical protein
LGSLGVAFQEELQTIERSSVLSLCCGNALLYGAQLGSVQFACNASALRLLSKGLGPSILNPSEIGVIVCVDRLGPFTCTLDATPRRASLLRAIRFDTGSTLAFRCDSTIALCSARSLDLHLHGLLLLASCLGPLGLLLTLRLTLRRLALSDLLCLDSPGFLNTTGLLSLACLLSPLGLLCLLCLPRLLDALQIRTPIARLRCASRRRSRCGGSTHQDQGQQSRCFAAMTVGIHWTFWLEPRRG